MDVLKNKINDFFKELKFEEKQHRYTVKGMFLPSVSGLIKNFVEPFNEKEVSYHSAIKQGRTQEEVLKEWDEIRQESCDRGHRVHLFGEHYVWNRELIPSCPQEKAIVKFWNDVPEHIIPFQMELQMFHKDFLFAGTCDILLFNTQTGEFILADYKTNKDLFKNYKQKKLKYPFGNMLDMPYNKYQIQLSFYQILFEQIGLKISSRKIVWLGLDGNYKMYDTEDLRKPLLTHLASRN